MVSIVNLDIGFIVQHINKIEKAFGDYLFQKYIIPQIINNLEQENHLEQKNNIEIDKDEIIKQHKDKFDKEYYTTKRNFITQENIIKRDLHDITKAEDIYDKYEKFSKNIMKTGYGFPDRYRCEYIILKNHKLHRCKNKVFKDKEIEVDADATNDEINEQQHLYHCKKHLGITNTHLIPYNKLLEQIKANLST